MRADIMRRYSRDTLTVPQQEFFERLVSFARLIQKFTQEKSWEQGVNSPRGLHASIVMAYVILRSTWGTHEIARKENNLSLVETRDHWKGKVSEHGGIVYRSYASWLDYSIDYSDELTNAFEIKKYTKLLEAKNLDEQLELFAEVQEDPTIYHGRIEGIIERYGLWEFDY